MITNLLELYTNQFSFNISVFKEEYLGVLIFLIVAVLLALVIAVLSYTLTSQKPESESSLLMNVVLSLMKILETSLM